MCIKVMLNVMLWGFILIFCFGIIDNKVRFRLGKRIKGIRNYLERVENDWGKL